MDGTIGEPIRMVLSLGLTVISTLRCARTLTDPERTSASQSWRYEKTLGNLLPGPECPQLLQLRSGVLLIGQHKTRHGVIRKQTTRSGEFRKSIWPLELVWASQEPHAEPCNHARFAESETSLLGESTRRLRCPLKSCLW
jgi:hypothetical protein